MDKQKQTLLIIGLVVLLGFLSIMVLVLQTKKNNKGTDKTENTVVATPTSVENIFEVPSVSPGLSPTDIPVSTQTGALDESLPDTTQNLATQKQELKSKLPINNNNFVIVFDYSVDQFIVTLKSPKDTNKTVFEDWLAENYPAIPIDRFTIK